MHYYMENISTLKSDQMEAILALKYKVPRGVT